MKIAIIRMLLLVLLATSLTAPAAAGETKPNNASIASAAKHQSGCGNTEKEKRHKKEKADQSDSPAEQEFNRVLMGIYG
ncbi:MAG TPA: hypothetical protein VE133_07080 [Candidatus Sulfotelmatobacter sp.]|nr:hypothetical protein [Candidatus Sulfotelmatobacter sp.]